MKSLESRLSRLEKMDLTSPAKEAGMIRLTGLWKSESEAGRKYLAGSISASSRLVVLVNEDKEKASDPDYIAYLAPQKKRG